MKETVLTNAELGEYAYANGYDTMSYYWNDSCHPAAYGYSTNANNCDNTNSYETSKVKEMLETRYLPTIGESNLKEIDDYKIRLIITNELNENLGWVNLQITAKTDNENANVPIWVYQHLGDQSGHVSGCWTMTPTPNSSSSVWYISSDGQIFNGGVTNICFGVRPVINLLKASIS